MQQTMVEIMDTQTVLFSNPQHFNYLGCFHSLYNHTGSLSFFHFCVVLNGLCLSFKMIKYTTQQQVVTSTYIT